MKKIIILCFNIFLLFTLTGCSKTDQSTPITSITGEVDRSSMLDSTQTVIDIYDFKLEIPIDYLYSREDDIRVEVEFPRPAGWSLNLEKDFVDYYLSKSTDYRFETWFRKGDTELAIPVCTVAVADILKVNFYEDNNIVETNFYKIVLENINENKLHIKLRL
ncbi:MAG: hypothetical protein M0R46_03955 [Candidatus Muirbacterium halophilum]|nr:hypothetical protein [Candidatus Muirbacterium halophilum]MCK9475046.1 hypothetical protein [Candidatus Muirbacterium halophilum]